MAISNPSANVSKSHTVETSHEDMIHDAQMDYYGKRLATCSSDRKIKIFDVVDGEAKGSPEILSGHSAPVFSLAWAHPKFGAVLASCSYDGKVLIWKEKGKAALGVPAGAPKGGKSSEAWEVTKVLELHKGSVNSIAWAPHELGPILACASSDSKISVITFNADGTTSPHIFTAHPSGTTSVAWAPAPEKKIASGGCDSLVKTWSFDESSSAWKEEESFDSHSDWVRGVAWAGSTGLGGGSWIASAGQDKAVYVHHLPPASSTWTSTSLNPAGFPDTCWGVSWSLAGNILAVSGGEGMVSLWKEKGGAGEGWECVSEMTS